MDEREKNLPKWAQELITDLRKRVEYSTEPLTRELAEIRPRVRLLETRNGALLELLECAAKGGHINSQTVISVIQGYGMELIKEEE